MTTAITTVERAELGKLMRLRGKVAKADAIAMGAQRLAEMEAQLAARYPENHPAWDNIVARIKQQATEADAQIAQLCREMGIPPEFRPSLHANWYGRGENALKDRRQELRAAAKAKIDAAVKTAHAKIDRVTVEQLTMLGAGMIASDEGRAFLESMPAIADLVPSITLAMVEETNPARLSP